MPRERDLQVLVVDDDLAWREITSRTLRRLGVSVDSVENGAQAVAAYARGAYDLVVMDCAMPVMDGPQAARTIRTMEESHRRAVIVGYSVDDQAAMRQRCELAGMDIFLAKPLTMLDLQALLAKVDRAKFDDESFASCDTAD